MPGNWGYLLASDRCIAIENESSLDLLRDQFDFSNKSVFSSLIVESELDIMRLVIGASEIELRNIQYSIWWRSSVMATSRFDYSRICWARGINGGCSGLLWEWIFSDLSGLFAWHNKSTPMTSRACEKLENWRGREIKTKKERSG